MAYSIWKDKFIPAQEVYQQPQVIVDFLENLLVGEEPLEDVLERYLEDSGISKMENPEANSHYVFFEYVLFTRETPITSYEITSSEEGYVEATLFDANGEAIWPRFGMAYKLNWDRTKISDYTIGRLQPYSRRHEEYSQRWVD